MFTCFKNANQKPDLRTTWEFFTALKKVFSAAALKLDGVGGLSSRHEALSPCPCMISGAFLGVRPGEDCKSPATVPWCRHHE